MNRLPGISGTGGRKGFAPCKYNRGSKSERKRRLTAGIRWNCKCQNPININFVPGICAKCGGIFNDTLGPETLGPETLGPETLGPKTLGPETLGPETLGPKTLGRGTLGHSFQTTLFTFKTM